MTQLATDNFNRADSPSGLGANWTTPAGNTAFPLVSNEANFGTNAASTFNSYYNAVSFPADQYSQAAVGTFRVTSASEGGGPSVRANSGTSNVYVVACNTSATLLVKFVGGSATALGSAAASATGDVLKLAVSGTSLQAYKNGVSIVGPITDATLSSGSAGLWGYGSSSSGALDSWEGGNLASGGFFARHYYDRHVAGV